MVLFVEYVIAFLLSFLRGYIRQARFDKRQEFFERSKAQTTPGIDMLHPACEATLLHIRIRPQL
jgi:hypothetical protein